MENLLIETIYARQTDELTKCREFTALENGAAARGDYDRLIADLCRTHLTSPRILAFLYSAAPPASADDLKGNLLEELGLDGGKSHPAMLLALAAAAGFDAAARRALEAEAQENFRRTISDPILFGTLREVGLSVLAETAAFEWMLSRTAGRIAAFLAKHRGLDRAALRWFHHHAEVDLRHAAEGVRAVGDYVRYYEIAPAEAELILEVTFRENVFLKRYFGAAARAGAGGGF